MQSEATAICRVRDALLCFDKDFDVGSVDNGYSFPCKLRNEGLSFRVGVEIERE